MDNGPEFIANITQEWSRAYQTNFLYIQPGKPTQNAFIERFNGTFRRGFLNAFLFDSLDQVRDHSWDWMEDYNNHRPHDSLGGLPPKIYGANLQKGVPLSED